MIKKSSDNLITLTIAISMFPAMFSAGALTSFNSLPPYNNKLDREFLYGFKV